MERPVVLLLETDAIARHALAEYLRECGYRVVEATSTDEALRYFEAGDAPVETALLDVAAAGARDVFSLVQWLRANQPGVDAILVGALETSAKRAAELCEAGPSLSKPYDHANVVDLIKRLRANRDRKT